MVLRFGNTNYSFNNCIQTFKCTLAKTGCYNQNLNINSYCMCAGLTELSIVLFNEVKAETSLKLNHEVEVMYDTVSIFYPCASYTDIKYKY